jgi:alpha-tubulin suppressor-like RCC1 family protein
VRRFLVVACLGGTGVGCQCGGNLLTPYGEDGGSPSVPDAGVVRSSPDSSVDGGPETLDAGGADSGAQADAGAVDAGVFSPDAGPLNVPVQRVAVGWAHGCFLGSTGGVKCWGSDLFGQRGDGRTDSDAGWVWTLADPAVDVIGLQAGAVSLSAGESFTCALMEDDTVECWGLLPGGGATPSPSPVVLSSIGPARQVAAGEMHVCVLLKSGGAVCWGDGGEMNLTSAPSLTSATPIPISGLTGTPAAIASGDGYSCALMVDGSVECWGGNHHGELGTGSLVPSDSSAPLPVQLPSPASALATLGGCQTCALLAGAPPVCWGNNDHGQVGDGTHVNRPSPVLVTGLDSSVKALAAGGEWNACALLASGAVLCWGDNTLSQFGNGGTVSSPLPVASGISSGASELQLGDSNGCARILDGRLLCWGGDDLSPRQVLGL